MFQRILKNLMIRRIQKYQRTLKNRKNQMRIVSVDPITGSAQVAERQP